MRGTGDLAGAEAVMVTSCLADGMEIAAVFGCDFRSTDLTAGTVTVTTFVDGT